MTISKNIQYIIIGVIVVALAAIVGLNFNKKNTFVVADYHKFLQGYEIADPQIAADETLKERYQARFNTAKEQILKDPNIMNYWMELASVKFAVGDYKGAEEIYLYVNKIRPENSVSFDNLGNLYTRYLPDYKKAEEMYKKNLENNPGDGNTYRNLYELYKHYYTEKADQRFAILEEATRAVPNEPSFWALLAQEYTEVGNKGNALLAWNQFLQMQPDNEQAKQAIAELQK